MPFDNDCGHIWLHGTYTCLLIIGSHVLISFLSFQIHRHVDMLTVCWPTVGYRPCDRGYQWWLRSNLRRTEIIFLIIFNKLYGTRLDAVFFENASPVKHSKRSGAFLFQNTFIPDFLNNRIWTRFYLQLRQNASFVSLGTRLDAFHVVRFARKWNAFQTRFEAKKIYMGGVP